MQLGETKNRFGIRKEDFHGKKKSVAIIVEMEMKELIGDGNERNEKKL